MRTRRFAALVPETRPDVRINLATAGDLRGLHGRAPLGGVIEIVIPHDFDGSIDGLRKDVAAGIEGPVRVIVRRAPLPPGPDEPRVTVTARHPMPSRAPKEST